MRTATGTVDCLLYLPEKYTQESEEVWPMVLFLHGRGESRGPLSLVAKWGPPKFAQRGDRLPYILVSPQCPPDGRWIDSTRQNQLRSLVEEVTKAFRVDEHRIYLTGLSMGGYGCWTLAANHPSLFAAVVPICGGGDPTQASKLVDLPIWAWHGDRDQVIPMSQSSGMVDAIRKAGGTEVHFTSLENVGHNSWSSAYALPELTSWLMKQRAR